MDHTHKHSVSIYADEWDDAGIMHYRGTGCYGDQSLDYEGNRWLRDAEAKDTGVFLFEKKRSGRYTFCGRVELADEPYRRREPDADGDMRWVWVFPLRVMSEAAERTGGRGRFPVRDHRGCGTIGRSLRCRRAIRSADRPASGERRHHARAGAVVPA